MIRPIMKDILFLNQKSEPATKNDLQVGIDLQDTLEAHRNECVGLAANMIGIRKNIIVINMGIVDIVMFNPIITDKDLPYTTKEGCLSIPGERETIRYQSIEVEYYDFKWHRHKQKLTGFPAQICQHEMDHLIGRLI